MDILFPFSLYAFHYMQFSVCVIIKRPGLGSFMATLLPTYHLYAASIGSISNLP